MLTLLSRSLREWFNSAVRREPASQLRALPQPDVFAEDLARLRGAWQRAHLRLLEEAATSDISIAMVPAPVGATAFVAGQGARIYSLDVFRSHGPRRPKAA